MSAEDTKRLQDLVQAVLDEPRSREEIKRTFMDAGIIDKSGHLKDPYKGIYIP